MLLGDTGVGKSSLVLKFVTGTFKSHSESTIGASFMSKLLTIDETTVKCQIWDTAGQEKYHSLAPMYYRNAACAILVGSNIMLLHILYLKMYFTRILMMKLICIQFTMSL